MEKQKYSDLLAEWLNSQGYTHCFYIAGGNIMHLLESINRRMQCIPVLHEVTAGIATEYFCETSKSKKAFALVTAGPGLTNIVTAIAGAYLESRELLILGGQVKTVDLSHGKLRQRGIQEVTGTNIVKPITVRSVLLEKPITKAEFITLINITSRKGPIFIEIPLDIQGRKINNNLLNGGARNISLLKKDIKKIITIDLINNLAQEIKKSGRPMFLLGGGVSRDTAKKVSERLADKGIPITTTWNGADRIGIDHPLYFGRPNTWGQRYSNLLLQQADLVIALGTRLGLQQTGFNWHQFVPCGHVIQIDHDETELYKKHPRLYKAICADANEVLLALVKLSLGDHRDWVEFCSLVKRTLPLLEGCNYTGPSYISPYYFVTYLSSICRTDDIIVPCSSGGAFTVMMQSFLQKTGQIMVTNKGLASMGYGLAGAIGSAFANPDRRIILVEGDGGFAQNLQELGTVAINKLNLKMFLFENNGYASIRMTQKNYFNGSYVGCDISTGLGLPDWKKLFDAYDIPLILLKPGFEQNKEFIQGIENEEPTGFLVRIDPDQTYLPKITSQITENGEMVSNPLHKMSPDLDEETYNIVGKYLPR